MSARNNLLTVIVLAFTVWLAQPQPLFGGDSKDPKKDAEARRAAEEDAAAKNINDESSSKIPIVHGKVELAPAKDGQKPDVLGTFTVGANVYLLKSDNDTIRDRLNKLDGKECSLAGKIRNDGKYFIAISIFEGNGAPPAPLRNRKGL